MARQKDTDPTLNLTSSEMKGRKLNAKQAGAMFLAATTLVTGAFGVSGCATKTSEIKTPEAIEATIPNEETVIESKTEAYAGAMEKYNQMSIDEFESLYIGERLKYAQFLIDSTDEGNFYDIFYGSGMPGQSYNIETTEYDKANSDQELLDSLVHRMQLAFLQSEPTEEIKKPLNRNDSKKLLSGIFYDVGGGHEVSNLYIDLSGSIDDSSYIQFIKTESPLASTNSVINEGIDKNNGDTVEYRDVVCQLEDGINIYYRFVYYSFTNYDGQDKSTWLLDASSDTAEGLAQASDVE